MSWSTAPTFVPGALATGDLNKLSDDLNVLGGAWTVDGRAASVIWTANTTNPTIGNGGVTSRYMSAGKLLKWDLTITMGSTTTFGSGGWNLVPPVTPLANIGALRPVGGAIDTSTGDRFPVFVFGGIGTGFGVQCVNSASPAKSTTLNSTTPFTWASTDILNVYIEFEAA